MNIMHITTRSRTLLRVTLLGVFGLVLLLGQSQSAFAQWTTNGNNINNTNTGNVGVGTTVPNAQLHVAGANGPSNNTAANAADALQVTGGVGGNGTWGGSAGGVGGALNLTGGTGGAPVAGSGAALGGKGGSINLAGGSGGPNTFGVGGGAGGDILINGGAGVVNNAGNVILANLRGNVGIGTTNPLAFASGTLSGGTFTHISSTGVTGLGLTGTFPQVLLYDSDGIPNNRVFQIMQDGGLAKIRVINDAISALTVDNVQVWNLSTGNVGIGTSAPLEKLHVQGNGLVTGNLTVNGNIAAKYQDVAEWVPATRTLPPGTVVTLNPTKSNLVEASSKAYDTRVAGVISAQPGITLGEHGENKVLVATTGRVKVKADATKAPINIGDLLVTSDTSGMAMKSEPITIGGRQIHSPGTLIGKALEPLAKGCGEILVLLSLQ